MQIFGFNITRATTTPTTKAADEILLSEAAVAWLRGEDPPSSAARSPRKGKGFGSPLLHKYENEAAGN